MSGDKKLVLVIEANEANAGLIKEALSLSNFEVLVCPDGGEALKLAAERGPQLVILEPMLQQGSVGGQTVYRRLRSDPKTANTPIIICTVQRDMTMRQKLNEKPPYMLHKPFDIKSLLAVVEKALAGA